MAFLAGPDTVVLDGEVVARPYETRWGVKWGMTLSADGSMLAYSMSRGEVSRVVVNGKESEDYESTSTPVASADGKTIAFRARKEGQEFVVVNGRAGPRYDSVTDPALTPDGKVVAYGAETEDGWVMVLGDRTVPVAVPHDPFLVSLSPDGRRHAYVSLPGKKAVIDGKEDPPFESVGRVAFSPDGAHVAYAAKIGGKDRLVVNGKSFDAPGRRTDPVFSPDSKMVGYAAVDGLDVWWRVIRVP